MTEKTIQKSGSYAPFVKGLGQGRNEIYFTVDGVHCANCIWNIENTLKSDPNVLDARLNFSTRRLYLSWQGPSSDIDDLGQKITALGYKIKVYEQGERIQADEERDVLQCLFVAGFASSTIMMFSVPLWVSTLEDMGLYTRDLLHWFSALIAFPSVLWAGRPFYKSAWNAIKNGRTNMDVPITVGVFFSCIMSVHQTLRGAEHAYFDAATMLLFFLLVGRYFDMRARGKARAYATDLLAMMGGTATVQDKDGTQKIIPKRDLIPGMLLYVASGEKIAADGKVMSGSSQVDTSLITGETIPYPVRTGDDVFAGTINMDSPIMVEVNRPQDGSVLSQIVRLMEKAQQSQAKYVRLSDRVARLYTPVVHIMALITFLGWMMFTSVSWDTAMMHALAVLIITCPCALGLAVPVVQVLATSTLMKKGILVKSGDAFERLSSADTIVFDKTGTLTYGTPSLINRDVIPDDQWPYIASLAAYSRHPLSRAITTAYKGKVTEIQDIKDIPGQGMSGLSDNTKIKIGKKSFVINDSSPDLDPYLSVYVQVGDEQVIRLLFSDQIREDAPLVTENLSKKGYEIYILSGDREGPVKNIADQLSIGLDHVRSSVTPPEKELFLQDLMKTGRKPIMVGDGLNDAPCLLAATASISPSTAIDMAQNAADLVFTSDRLASVSMALYTAKFSQKLVRQNLAMALLYNVVAIPIAMAGYVTPLIAAIAMSLSSLVVVANAFRLTGKRIYKWM